ncbi:MAG TPA: DUF3892 domain-containing protein [Candidatus Limnocylindria bacterium]|jgi:hypothetical protein|nr:DUF3892 domain-containing protein [Candidatus Limnocylindria bacterium]
MSLKIAIESILKHRENEPFERVRAIGGTTVGGGRWILLEDQAINAIELDRSSFFVLKNGQELEVVVGRSSTGIKYLKTTADAEVPLTLLGLPDHYARPGT